MNKVNLPKNSELKDTLLSVIKKGEVLSSKEIDSRIIENLKLSKEQVNFLHNAEKGNRTELAYRLAWIRTSLKKEEILEKDENGSWSKN
jgi:restriction system protein